MEKNLFKKITKKIIEKYIWKYFLLNKIKNQRGLLKLNLGAGNNPIKGWINADITPRSWNILYVDVKKKMPFKSNTFDYIMLEHLIEHLSWQDGKKMLKECFRILKKGGKLRISTPNIIFVVSLYKKNSNNEYYTRKITRRFLKNLYKKNCRPVFVINNAFYNWGHKFLYDQKLLVEALQEARFKEIKREYYGNSRDNNLNKIETHEKGVGDIKVCQIESIVLEALKRKN